MKIMAVLSWWLSDITKFENDTYKDIVRNAAWSRTRGPREDTIYININPVFTCSVISEKSSTQTHLQTSLQQYPMRTLRMFH